MTGRRRRGDTTILTVYNTLSRRKEPLRPIAPGRILMYVCGPNLYDPIHVGHAFSYAFFDVVRRYLEYRGYEVTHVQNFTDIEDRIIERAASEGRHILEIADEYIERFFREMDALGVRRAHHYPRASAVMPKIIAIIEALIASGHAYAADGDVYYRITAFPRYGRLARRSIEQMQAGARVEVDPRKEHPMDFALWKAAKLHEPSWQSPWGPGRPGWHIECSAMNLQYLGERIDIHGGGQDLIFPHHENEIAQSEAYTGKAPFVGYWLHHAMMEGAAGEEMHRHLRNFVSLAEALARYEPDAIRLFLLSTHYRSPLRWTEEAVRASARGLARVRTALLNAGDAIARAADTPDAGLAASVRQAREEFERAMDDDFNTPQALAALFTLATEVNKVADAATGRPAGRPELLAATETLRDLAQVLGLSLPAVSLPAELGESLRQMLGDLRRDAPEALPEPDTRGTPEELVGALVDARRAAREGRKYALADRIRARLGELGIVLEDLPDGTRWRYEQGARAR